jgi:hypothetical protein
MVTNNSSVGVAVALVCSGSDIAPAHPTPERRAYALAGKALPPGTLECYRSHMASPNSVGPFLRRWITVALVPTTAVTFAAAALASGDFSVSGY